MKHTEILKGQRENSEVTTDVTCDICGKTCWTGQGGYSFAEFRAHWGYGSKNKDGTNWFSDLCEEDAEKIKTFIENLGGKVRIEHYIL